jgi:hypothetical protein
VTVGRVSGVTGAVRTAWFTLALVLAVLGFRVEPAAACSCAIGDPRAMLAGSDAAFVGTFVEKHEPARIVTSADDAVYVFRVERVVKGSLGDTVEVVSPTSGASCGLEVSPGDRIGLFLTREAGVWRSVLCLQIEPERLLAAVRPLPAPSSRGPLALLVGGRAGDVRTIGLDTRGRTVAYGRGRGETLFLATCPGSRRAVEYAWTQPGYLLAVRDLRTFRIVRERRYRPRGHGSVAAVACSNATGTELAVFETAEVPPAAARLVVGGRTIWSGKALAAAFTSEGAYLSAGVRGNSLTRVDLRTAKAERLAALPPNTGSLSVAPDRRVAGVAYSPPLRPTAPPSRVVVFDPAARPTVRGVPLSQSNVTGTVAWSAGRLVFLPDWGTDTARVYDARLRVIGRFSSWQAGESLVVDGRAYGIGRGALFAASLPRGPARMIRNLPTPVTNALAAAR